MGTNYWYYKHLFENKIIQLSRQSFEDFFTQIMKAKDGNFMKVKAYGRDGDGACDGYNGATGDFYLIYAPDELTKDTTQLNAISKIKNDIDGIVKKWNNIKTINYVINDKFLGLGPKVHKLIIELQKDNNLPPIKILTMEDLCDICLSLDERNLQAILGFQPDISNIKPVVDFEIISEIVKYIEKNTLNINFEDNLIVPDFAKKILHNKLSKRIADILNLSSYYVSKVEEFFDKSPIYNKEDLKNRLCSLYLEACEKIDDSIENYADKRFFYILDKICYDKQSKAVADNAAIILTLFFESCDIFEEPKE